MNYPQTINIGDKEWSVVRWSQLESTTYHDKSWSEALGQGLIDAIRPDIRTIIVDDHVSPAQDTAAEERFNRLVQQARQVEELVAR